MIEVVIVTWKSCRINAIGLSLYGIMSDFILRCGGDPAGALLFSVIFSAA